MTPEEVLHDWTRRYNHTYLFVQEPDSQEENLFFVEGVTGNADKLGVLQLSSNDVGSIRLNFGSAHTLKFVSAPVGVFQFGSDAWLCRRRPMKQYRRGICQDNTTIQRVTASIDAGILDNGWSFELIKAAFERATHSLPAALKLLTSNKYRSVALENNFSISVSTTEAPEYILLFWGVAVARLSKDGKSLHVYEKAMEPQVKQYLMRELGNATS